MRVDKELWEHVREGDAEAFGDLFERHARAIYNYCFRQTADWATAEDLVSVVFLEAWRRRDQIILSDSVLPWLYGIAANVLRNHRRSLRRYRAALSRLPLPEPASDFTSELHERLSDQVRMAQVLKVASRLSRRQQQVLALCDWTGLSYREASLALGWPIGTVRSTLSRARERMRELVTDGGHLLSEMPSTDPGACER
jgi:RNA polymerase sigma factor (sigma-70 family)